MKNPFEGLSSRRGKYEDTANKVASDKQEIERIDGPFGHLETDDLFANMCHETLNAVASIPDLPRRKFLELRVKMAQNKLQRIRGRDEKEAQKLNEKYAELIKKASETGDDTERNKFEKEMLGME